MRCTHSLLYWRTLVTWLTPPDADRVPRSPIFARGRVTKGKFSRHTCNVALAKKTIRSIDVSTPGFYFFLFTRQRQREVWTSRSETVTPRSFGMRSITFLGSNFAGEKQAFDIHIFIHHTYMNTMNAPNSEMPYKTQETSHQKFVRKISIREVSGGEGKV